MSSTNTVYYLPEGQTTIKIELPDVYIKGYGGFYIGSKEYFKKLNQDNYINTLLHNADSQDYYNAIISRNKTIKAAIDEILKDLENHISVIHLLTSQSRMKMAKFIGGLHSYLMLSEKRYRNADLCNAILVLSDKRTGYKSNAANNVKFQAVKMVKTGIRNINLSLNDRVSLVKKAGR